MCALQEPLGDIVRIEMYALFIIIIIVIIIIIIIVTTTTTTTTTTTFIYNCILSPTKQKEKGKRLHYLRCGNSSLNDGNIGMFNRA